MDSSLTLGRVAGIRIGLNWSWLFVFALITWSLATAVFPDQNPGLGEGTYWVMAAVASGLFFASILLHELGHALQARRDGVDIEEIVLWLFGGVARLKGEPSTSGAEFRIAVAGPLVTLAIAATLVVVGPLVELPAAVDGVVVWLGFINIMLLVFNLIPALPLDGGRILHAALWAARNDEVWATRVGATIGRGFGFLLVAGGIVLFFTGDFVGGIWLAFIGWFLSAAATAEERTVLARRTLGDLRVGELMVPDPVTVPSNLTLGEFMDEIVWRNRHTTYPVVDDGRPLGLLPFRRVAEVPRAEWESKRVEACVVPLDQVPIFTPDQRVVDILSDLFGSDVRRGLVLADGRLLGLLSATDVSLALQLGRGPGRRARR